MRNKGPGQRKSRFLHEILPDFANFFGANFLHFPSYFKCVCAFFAFCALFALWIFAFTLALINDFWFWSRFFPNLRWPQEEKREEKREEKKKGRKKEDFFLKTRTRLPSKSDALSVKIFLKHSKSVNRHSVKILGTVRLTRKNFLALYFHWLFHFSTPQTGLQAARFFVFWTARKVRNQEARPHVFLMQNFFCIFQSVLWAFSQRLRYRWRVTTIYRSAKIRENRWHPSSWSPLSRDLAPYELRQVQRAHRRGRAAAPAPASGRRGRVAAREDVLPGEHLDRGESHGSNGCWSFSRSGSYWA